MMLHKLRRAMVAPEREPLKWEVEVDEFFLGGYEEGLKGGRARGKKVMCGVAVEVRRRGSGRLRLAILENASGRSLGAFVQATTEPGAVVHTDGWQGYNVLTELGYEHSPMVQNGAEAGHEPYLPRAHRAISNLKAWLNGTHRRASPRHLQAYLDEFVFRQPHTPRSRRCSASAPDTSQPVTARSSTRPPDPSPETIGYALRGFLSAPSHHLGVDAFVGTLKRPTPRDVGPGSGHRASSR